MKNIDSIIKYSINQGLIYKKINSVLLVYNSNNSDMYEFNEIGMEILDILLEEISIKQLLEQLCKKYNVSKSEIFEDVDQFINRMIQLGIIIDVEYKNE